MPSEVTNQIIKNYQLERHDEGGYFKQIYKAKDKVKPLDKRYNGEERSASTLIYFLLAEDDFSAFHKLKSDEIWTFYKGGLLEIIMIDSNGKLTKSFLGGPDQPNNEKLNISNVVIIPQGTWFAAALVDKTSYCLVTCSVTPGFEYPDFELANRKALSFQFPQHKNIIEQFTRIEKLDNKMELDGSEPDEAQGSQQTVHL